MTNLPPGVSVSDLPGNGPQPEPECHVCGNYPHLEALEDGYPLCEEHNTEAHREAYDEYMENRRREWEQPEDSHPIPDEEQEKREQELADRYRGDDGDG